MRKLFIPLLAALALLTAVKAEKLCKITSKLDKDVVIKMSLKNYLICSKVLQDIELAYEFQTSDQIRSIKISRKDKK